jgi:predicted RNA binding protein YcfA (HicA-like mRNA interferase family)
MIWKCPRGHSFPVPQHPGDLKHGTLKAIVKQAGLNMSLSGFMQLE